MIFLIKYKCSWRSLSPRDIYVLWLTGSFCFLKKKGGNNMILILQLAIILVASKVAGSISVRLGQRAVLGKLLIWIVLGPSVLGLVNNTDMLQSLSQIGVILLMFIAGLETDINEFKRTGKAAAYVGFGGIIAPLALGYAAGIVLGLTTFEALFLGLLLSAT